MLKIYLAGPDVFRHDANKYGKILKRVCAAFGFEGLFPLDNNIDFDKDMMPEDMAALIYEENIDLIKKCDIVLANMERFRGPSMDVGAAYEMGYAHALGKKVYGYAGDPRDYQTVVSSSPRTDMLHVENFRLRDNLMVAASVECYPSVLEALYAIENAVNKVPEVAVTEEKDE